MSVKDFLREEIRLRAELLSSSHPRSGVLKEVGQVRQMCATKCCVRAHRHVPYFVACRWRAWTAYPKHPLLGWELATPFSAPWANFEKNRPVRLAAGALTIGRELDTLDELDGSRILLVTGECPHPTVRGFLKNIQGQIGASNRSNRSKLSNSQQP